MASTPRLRSSLTPDASPLRYAVAARELLRNTLLDAARELIGRGGWSRLTMSEIAAAAGVSRQTLYKEFGSREEFAQALVLRESDRFLTAVEEAVNQHLDDPATALSAAFDVFLTAAAEDALMRTVLFGDDSQSLLPFITTRGTPLVRHAADSLAGIITRGWPRVALADAQLLGECLVRLAISYAALPTESASMTAASVTSLLGPYIERLLAN